MKIQMRRGRKQSLWNTIKPRLCDTHPHTKNYGAEYVAQRIKHLLGMNEAPSSILSTMLSQVWKSWRQEDKKFRVVFT